MAGWCRRADRHDGRLGPGYAISRSPHDVRLRGAVDLGMIHDSSKAQLTY